jgi:plastocyanin
VTMRTALCVLALLAMPALAGAATQTVTIEGMKFQPESVTVKPGDTVVWQNKDVVPHTATATGKFDSKNLDGGQSWTWTAGAKGRYDYVCTYHPGMKGTVMVE